MSPIAPPTRKYKQVPGESIQLHVLAEERVQIVKALAQQWNFSRTQVRDKPGDSLPDK
jgi:hypothetical protein